MSMPEPIESLLNLGPCTARWLAEIDVHDTQTLRELGAVEAFARLKFRFGRGISLNALWAMDAALSGIHWLHLGESRKDELRRQLAKRLPGSKKS